MTTLLTAISRAEEEANDKRAEEYQKTPEECKTYLGVTPESESQETARAKLLTAVVTRSMRPVPENRNNETDAIQESVQTLKIRNLSKNLPAPNHDFQFSLKLKDQIAKAFQKQSDHLHPDNRATTKISNTQDTRALQDTFNTNTSSTTEPLKTNDTTEDREARQSQALTRVINRWKTIPILTDTTWREATIKDPDTEYIKSSMESKKPLEHSKLSNKRHYQEWAQDKLETENGIVYHWEEPKARTVRQL
jgi:hypothetical protein